ncbi:MAG: DEAD/DEAH box helicase, partial [Planctomycetaceae bacterium]
CTNLERAKISAEAIHADKTQGAREHALDNFKKGKTRVLIASDIVSRGIDVEEISHVINYDLPNEAETYIHRIGRTGRAGAKGKALSFCDMEERAYLDDIEKLVKHEVMAVEVHPFPSPLPRAKKTALPPNSNSSKCRPSRSRSLMGRRRR